MSPFSNSMEPDNMPSNSDSESPGSMASITAGGTLPKKVDYPLPPDVNAPSAINGGSGDEISDFGVNETVEVGHKGGVSSYGLK